MGFSAEQIREKGAELDAAFETSIGRPPTSWERQTILAQAWLETGMGEGWTGECAKSNNWGAIQSLKPSCCSHVDHRKDGSAYTSFFACYETDFDAAVGLVHEGYVRRKGTLDAARAGDLGTVATLLHDSSYYGGICKGLDPKGEECRRKVIVDYALGLRSRAEQIAKAYGEPVIPMGNLPADPLGRRNPDAPAESGGSGSGGLFVAGALAAGALGLLALTVRRR